MVIMKGQLLLKSILLCVAFYLMLGLLETKVLGIDEADYYRERLEFDAEGNLQMTTHDKKATSAIRYATVGWTIKRYDMPIDAPGQECAYIKLYQHSDIQYREDPEQAGYLYCYYYGDKEEIYNAIGVVSKEWQHQLYAYGGTVYIDSILTIREYDVLLGGLIDSNGNDWGEVYYTYEGISEARPWASKESLRTHFNKSVFYPPRVKEKEYGYTQSVINTVTRTYNPTGTFRIGAGEKGQEYFDVTAGIPTGKSLYIDGEVDAYRYEIIFTKMRVKLKIPIAVQTQYQLRWTDYHGNQTQEVRTVTRWYYIERQADYWKLSNMEFSYLNQLLVENYAFTDESVLLEDFQYTPEVKERRYKNYYDYLKLPEYEDLLVTEDVVIEEYGTAGIKPSIPDTDYQSLVEAEFGEIQVRNDSLKIDNKTVLKSQWESKATAPVKSSEIPNTIAHIYEKDYQIPHTKKNATDNPTTITAYYKNIEDAKVQEIQIQGCNSVSIHTPVCASLSGERQKAYNQLMQPQSEDIVFILGGEGKLTIHTYGTHKDIQGYGSRDYSQYVKKSCLKIPFDVIYNDNYIEAETWFTVEQGEIVLQIPVGVPEGYYDIKLRNYANNYKAVTNEDAHVQSEVNLKTSNYIAADTLTVRVVGRIYGLSIGSTDYRVGNKDENGVDTGYTRVFPYVRSSWKNTTIPFSLKTIGDVEADTRIKIILTGYHIAKDGSRQEVALYDYHADTDTIVKRKSQLDLTQSDCKYIGTSADYQVKDSAIANAGMQKWSGNLNFGENVYVIPATQTLSSAVTKEELEQYRIRDGYLLLNFEIWTVQDGSRYLTYLNRENYEKGYCSMWKTEGYNKQWTLRDNKKISVIMGDSILLPIQEGIIRRFRVVGTH